MEQAVEVNLIWQKVELLYAVPGSVFF